MSATIVRVRDVVHDFGRVRALDGVSLDVEQGVVHGLLGPNGAGKTTLIRVLATLLRPASGSVEVAGVDVLADPTAARARIGLAGQFAAVDAYLTGRENVEMVGRLYGLRGGEARRRAARCSSASGSRRTPTVASRRTRAACGAGSTSPPRSSDDRRSCSSTSRRPASIRAAAWTCGSSSSTSSRRARPCC
jgi:ABC-type Na+ transport system ATPase subunit NatA